MPGKRFGTFSIIISHVSISVSQSHCKFLNARGEHSLGPCSQVKSKVPRWVSGTHLSLLSGLMFTVHLSSSAPDIFPTALFDLQKSEHFRAEKSTQTSQSHSLIFQSRVGRSHE